MDRVWLTTQLQRRCSDCNSEAGTGSFQSKSLNGERVESSVLAAGVVSKAADVCFIDRVQE